MIVFLYKKEEILMVSQLIKATKLKDKRFNKQRKKKKEDLRDHLKVGKTKQEAHSKVEVEIVLLRQNLKHINI